MSVNCDSASRLLHASVAEKLLRIREISIRDKRRYFSLLRRNCGDVDEHWFFPAKAVTVGELCVAQILDQDVRKKSRATAPAIKPVVSPELAQRTSEIDNDEEDESEDGGDEGDEEDEEEEESDDDDDEESDSD